MSGYELFGKKIKELRIALGKTLREFCKENGLDHGNHSKLERGKAKPPKAGKLRSLAIQLGLKESSDEWYELHDLASASRREFPDDIMPDEDLAEKLPVLFRTLRGDRLSEDDLKKLAEKIRRS